MAGTMSDYEVAVISDRQNGPFPKLPLEGSAKKWQKSFFYVRNVVLGADFINLPPFVNET